MKMTGSQLFNRVFIAVAISSTGICSQAMAQSNPDPVSQQHSSRVTRLNHTPSVQGHSVTDSIPVTTNELRPERFPSKPSESAVARNPVEDAKPIYDSQVVRASYVEPMTNRVPLDSRNRMLDVPGRDDMTHPGNVETGQQPGQREWQPIPLSPKDSGEVSQPEMIDRFRADRDARRVSGEQFQQMVLKIAFNTVIVIFVAVGILLSRKKLWKTGVKDQKPDSNSKIQLMDTFKISPKTSIHLLQVCDQRILVASNDNQLVQLLKLASFGDLVEGETTPAETPSPGNQVPSIHEQLAMYLANDQIFKKQ